MVYLPALFANGRIVVGTNHGDAFSKLDAHEQENVSSGFVDPNNHKWISENEEFFLKELILIRHAHTGDWFDPGISGLGYSQCDQLADFVRRAFDFQQFKGFTSCCNRTRETAERIFGRLGLGYEVHPNFCDQRNWKLPCNRAADHWNESPYSFLERLHQILEFLPAKCIIVSHCNFIVNMSQMCMGLDADITAAPQWKGRIPHCSVTYVKYNQLVFVGETDFINKLSS